MGKEITTCEEYVINELKESKEMISKLQDRLMSASKEIERLYNIYNDVKEIVSIRKHSYGLGYVVTFDDIYESSSKQRYEMFKEYFELEEPQENDD